MNVQEAVQRALGHAKELFASENITNLGLEEVEFDEAAGEWLVTVGFSRPWDYQKQGALAALASQGAPPLANRSFKVIRLKDRDSAFMGVKNWAPGD